MASALVHLGTDHITDVDNSVLTSKEIRRRRELLVLLDHY